MFFIHNVKSSRSESRLLGLLVDICIIVSPLSLLPQLFRVWLSSDVNGVSVYTWLLTFLATMPLIIYDIKHKVIKLAIMHLMIATISLGIAIGVIVRG